MGSVEDLLPPPKHGNTDKCLNNVDHELIKPQIRQEIVPLISSAPLAQRRARFDLRRPSEDAKKEIIEQTQEFINDLIMRQSGRAPGPPKETILEHTPAGSSTARTLRIVEAEQDPLEPPRHRIVQDVQRPPSPPAPILRAPAPKLTAKEREEWSIPAAVSQWTNKKGYILPLEHRKLPRIAVEPETSKHSQLAEALTAAEQQTMAEANDRQKEEEKRRMLVERQQELRQKLLQARGTKRFAQHGLDKERPRDVSEQVALGQHSENPSVVQFDSRLYHNPKRSKDAYDEPLFSTQKASRSLYRPRSFAHETPTTSAPGPIEFEKDEEER